MGGEIIPSPYPADKPRRLVLTLLSQPRHQRDQVGPVFFADSRELQPHATAVVSMLYRGVGPDLPFLH
jgi:hypothetical protein